MDRRANSNADQNVKPDPMNNFDDLFGGIGQPLSTTDGAVIVVIANWALKNKGLNLVLQLEIADQSFTNSLQLVVVAWPTSSGFYTSMGMALHFKPDVGQPEPIARGGFTDRFT